MTNLDNNMEILITLKCNILLECNFNVELSGSFMIFSYKI